MSYVYSSSTSHSNVNLVEQILDQGQRLRNAMVQSILSNDPCHNLTPRPMQKMHAINMDEESAKREISTAEKHEFIAYLKGDDMSRLEEKRALETFRAMSNADICEATERSYDSVRNSCDCDTCKTYGKKDFTVRDVPPLNLKSGDRRVTSHSRKVYDNKNNPFHYLRYVDTLKIAVHSLKLSHEGNVKVSSSFDRNSKYPQNLSTTYFIEYDIPNCMVKNVVKKSKVNTGLESSNIVKLCSKKLHKEAIYFKQISIHDVVNLDKLDLDTIDLKFQVSCRTLKQKGVNVIGHARFNMGSFADTKYLSCNQELIVFLKHGTPIVLGTIKIALQLGCGRLYFGKEFLDSISNDKENNVVLPEIISYDKTDELSDEPVNMVNDSDDDFLTRFIDVPKSRTDAKISTNIGTTKVVQEDARISDGVKSQPFKPVKPCRSRKTLTHVKENMNTSQERDGNISAREISNKTILFGFIYISEVLYLDEKQNTYFTCQPFCQNDLINSNVANGGANPVFNFYQRIPIIYEEEFLSKLRDNFMIFEFWEKLNYKEVLIGVCSIPLHQYYLAFRNPVIVKYLARNKLPVIGTDWYEPIADPTTGTISGQVQILVALGSETQIHNLENERGFRDNIVVKAKRTFSSRRPLIEETRTVLKSLEITNKCVSGKTLSEEASTVFKDQKTANDQCSVVKVVTDGITTADKSTHKIDTIDKASQSDPIPMDNRSSDKENMLDNILQQFVAQQQHNLPRTNTGTNTDPPILDNLRKTTDLLDTLNDALTVDVKQPSPNSFKAHIVIEAALHLPSRRKCKAKKVKGKHIREEILPSTYVTFETDKEGDVQVTRIIQKSTSPKWDYRCDVCLPSDLLTNNQKRLIFKVWKKANMAVLQPNMQIDTVLGFAALDLTVFLAGLPTVQGWFNIIDFSSKCNGQIKINVTPLENISRFSERKNNLSPNSNIVEHEEPTEPGEVLSRALKRKFIELDEITQRLRSRLSRVTNEESDVSNDEVADEFEKDINTLCVEDDYDMVDFVHEAQTLNMQRVSSSLMKWQGVKAPDNQTLLLFVDDESATDAEKTKCDLNKWAENLILSTTTTHTYVDSKQLVDAQTETFQTHVDFESQTEFGDINADSTLDTASCSKLSEDGSEAASTTALDRQLTEGKQRIDTLLQKLSLISKNEVEPFSSRYVSGCSVSQEADQTSSASKTSTDEDIMHELGLGGSQFDANRLFDAKLRGEMNDGSKSTSSDEIGGSTSSLVCNQRDAPDGEGNAVSEKKGKDI